MIRILGIFFVLFAGAILGLTLLPKPTHESARTSPVAQELRAAAGDTPTRDVRVVYPPSASPQPTQDMPAQPQAAVMTPPSLAPVASEAAVVPAQMPSRDPVQASVQALNINTASAESLDRLIGGGRIGRTIVSHRPYRSVEDLLAKRVVRKSVYDRIKAQIAAQ